MAKEQSNYPGSLDVLIVDRQSGQVVTSASYDIIEDAITEMQAEMRRVTTKSGTATLTSSEGGMVLVTAAAPYTLGLPAASNDLKGLTYFIVKTDDNTNLITIDANSSETINGELTYTGLNKQWKWVMLRLDGSNWIIVGEPKVQASDVEVSEIGASTYDDVQDWLNNTQSGGRISGGVISDDSSGGIAISSGAGIIQTTTGDIGLTHSFDWSADTITSTGLTDDSANYIYMDYNAGSPQILATSDRTTIRLQDQFTLGRIYKSGTDIHIINSGVNLYNAVRRMHEVKIEVSGFQRASGGVISESAVTERALNSTVGIFFLGDNEIITSAKDTSTGGSDYFTSWYYVDSAWTSSTGQQQIDNLQYNDITSTGLETLTTNRYGVHWVYVHFDSDIQIVYGQGDYKLSEAEIATIPDDLPSAVSDFGTLATKIILQKTSTGFTSVVTAYKQLFPVSSPIEHNDLSGLDIANYQHLTQVEHDEITPWISAVALSTGGTVDIPSGQEYQINSSEVKLDEWATPTDVTTLNATTGLHGLLPKGDADTTHYLAGDISWVSTTGIVLDSLTTPTTGTALNSSTGRHGLLIALDGSTGNYLRGDGSWQTPPDTDTDTFVGLSDTPADFADDASKLLRVDSSSGAVEFVSTTGLALDTFGTPTDVTTNDATTGHHGLLLKLTGSTSTYLNADGAWTTPPDTGEVNTASNAGTTGIGIYYTKSTYDLQFKAIHSTGNILVTDSTGTHTVNLDVDSTGIALDNLGTPSTGTTLDSSTGRHGLLPILGGNAATWLDGTGVFSAPTASEVGAATTGVKLDDWATPDDNTDLNATTGYHGLLPKRDGNAAHWLDGSGLWTAPTASEVGAVDISGTPVANDIPRFTDANTIEGLSYAELKAALDLEIGTDILAQQTIGIANDNLVEIDDADAANDDYAKFTAVGLEGRSYSEVKSDLSLNLVENTALSTWGGTSNIITVGTITNGVWSGTALVIGKIPTAIVSNGDTTHVPTCDNVYDFCETTKNYLQNIVEDTTPQLGGDLELNAKNIDLTATLASDHTYSGLTDSQPVGEAVAFGALLYFNWTDKEWKKTDADAAATMPGLRIALETKADGQDCVMLVKGYIRDDSWNFTGAMVYASVTLGAMSSTAPTGTGDQIQRVGVAKSADILFFDPSIDVGEI